MAFIAEGQNEVSMERANKQEESINSSLNNIEKNVTRNGLCFILLFNSITFSKVSLCPPKESIISFPG